MDQILEIKDNLMNEEFNSLADSRERVEYAFEKLGPIENIRQNVSKYLSDNKTENLKSLEKSQAFRQKGNLYLSKKNYEYALYYFSSAVMSAPYPIESGVESDNELTYAFTARSVTFFEMKAYGNALFDINCALNLSEFSMKFMERLQLMIHKVYCLCRLRRYYSALSVITAIIQLIPCLPIHNQTVSSLIKMKDQIMDRINEESEESKETKQFESELETIEVHIKNIESFRSPELELRENETKGRHYIAVEPIPKGKIMAVEKALSGVLFKNFFTTHCQNCFKNIGYKCWPCRQCSQVVFCDQQCADKAYHHTHECGIIEILHNLGTSHHLLYKIILSVGPQMAIELAKETTIQTNLTVRGDHLIEESDPKKLNYLKFVQLIDHKDKYCLKTKIPSICRSIQMAFILDSFEELRPKDRLIEDYLKDLSALLDTFNYKAFINVFGMYEHMSEDRAFRGGHIGNALMFEASFFNHSCSPNAYWIFNGQHISVVTTEAIKKDQEVSISYGPYSHGMSFEERQETLSKKYFFRCNCNQCVTDAKSLPTLKCHNCSDGFFIYQTDSTQSSCMKCGESLDISSVVERVKEIEKSFEYWINKFDTDCNEVTLINAEKCYSNFYDYLYSKSERMIEINTKLSRSFESIENYSKAMVYSKNNLDSMDDNKTFRYCVEMVFYSRTYYYFVRKQRNILTIDDEWRNCFKTIAETIVILKNCKNDLLQTIKKKSYKKSDLEVIEKAIEVVEGCIKSKEKQIRVISKMIDNSSSEPIDN